VHLLIEVAHVPGGRLTSALKASSTVQASSPGRDATAHSSERTTCGSNTQYCPLQPNDTVDLPRSDPLHRGDKSVEALEIPIDKAGAINWRWPCLSRNQERELSG
jgi:hypothetical protein